MVEKNFVPYLNVQLAYVSGTIVHLVVGYAVGRQS